jgi:hypothetical protein
MKQLAQNPIAALAKAKADLATCRGKSVELEGKRAELIAGDGGIETIRKFDADLATVRQDAGNLVERIGVLETECRKLRRAELEQQWQKNLEMADRLMARTIAAEIKKIEAAGALAKAAKAADDAHAQMKIDWPAGLAYAEMSTVRTATDRRFRDAFTRPGARLPDLMVIVGDLGRAIEEAGINALAVVRAQFSSDENEDFGRLRENPGDRKAVA